MERTRTGRRPGTVDVVVIGAGHSGLAMSAMLTRRSIDHVVLERGEPGNAWRTERWDSLRLLTPNWLTRLPGYCYDGGDPHGFMAATEVAGFVSSYAARIAAPVLTGTTVTRVAAAIDGYRVLTDCGAWHCRAVVLANGAFGRPVVPAAAADLPARVRQITAGEYRNPAQVDEGGVLVVGASATGVQLADELNASGRQVTIAVGEHVRLPRNYRGRDIQWWMLATGVSDQRIEDVDDPVRARRVPSPQLVGSDTHETLDLNTLRARGVEVVGRLAAVRDGKALLSGSLRNVCALADLKMNRLLSGIDAWIDEQGSGNDYPAPETFEPTVPDAAPRLQLDLDREIRTVVWATGFRPDLSWLHLPVFDPRGNLRHQGGVVDAPGIYILGLPFLRRRKSSFMHGAEDDVAELSAHLAGHLDKTAMRAPMRAAV